MTRTVQPCGTAAAYKRHLRHYQVPCGACTRAAALDVRLRRCATPAARTSALFRELLDLISTECQRAGMLP